MLPICVPCHRFFRPKKNGFYFIEGMPRPGEDHAKPGLEEPTKWVPYKVWVGDLYECPDCRAQIISGFGRAPIAEHYQPDFVGVAVSLGADQYQVNDCC